MSPHISIEQAQPLLWWAFSVNISLSNFKSYIFENLDIHYKQKSWLFTLIGGSFFFFFFFFKKWKWKDQQILITDSLTTSKIMNGQGKDHNVCVFVSMGRWFVSYKYYLIFILNLFCEKRKRNYLKGTLEYLASSWQPHGTW